MCEYCGIPPSIRGAAAEGAPPPPPPEFRSQAGGGGPPQLVLGPCEPCGGGAPRPPGTVLLAAGCGLLALWPPVLIGPPAPALPPPHVIADRLEPTYGAGQPVELRAVPALTRLEFRTDVGEVRTLAYRCDSPGDVRAVAVTDLAGEVVHQPLPTAAEDGATPALLCDGNPHEVRVLLVLTGDPEVVPSEGPSRMLMMTRVM